MVSRVQNRTALHRNMQHYLRSITKSHEVRSKTSAILDASEYIRSLKQKLQELNQLVAAHNFIDDAPMPMLKVETQEEGFVIKVVSQRSCEGLLVFILEAFEELGLEILKARVSCVDTFLLDALALKESNQGTHGHHIDAQIIEQVVSQAIQNWRELSK